MKIPSHYRQLKPNETIRKGDLCKHEHSNYGTVDTVSNFAIGKRSDTFNGWTFWRRRHVKKSSAIKTDTSKGPHSITVVGFYYKGKNRVVQMIKMDDTYLKGLEMNWNKEKKKYSYQFKSFLLNRIFGNVVLIHYGKPL